MTYYVSDERLDELWQWVTHWGEVSEHTPNSGNMTETECREKIRMTDNLRDEIKVLRELRARRAIGATPDGWQLVPVEPTEAMINASADLKHPPMANYADKIRGEYAVMLGAAPKPPV